MSFYLSQVLAYFVLPSVLLAQLWASHRQPRYLQRFWYSVLAIAGGAGLFGWLPYGQSSVLVADGVYTLSLVALLVSGLRSCERGRVLLFWQFLLLCCGGFLWARSAKLSMLSPTAVINTGLILNVSALAGGFILIILSHYFVGRLFSALSMSPLPKRGEAKPPARSLHVIVLVLLVVLALLPLSGDILLAGMKLQVLPIDSTLLSYVAKVTNFYSLYTYGVLLLSLLPLCAYFLHWIKPLKQLVKVQDNPIQKRKLQARLNQQMRLTYSFFSVLVLVFVSLLYWDAVASQPPKLSPATPVQMAEDGALHLPITEQLSDGKLHRFKWVASDGKVVRFFIIDRYPGQQKFGVVFDACMLCGDTGYIQEGNQVICLACGVHIFIPSIGHLGGCNPIPIKGWKVKDGDIVITHQAMESGLQYFSQVEKIQVVDPVNGQTLTNVDADYSYEFGGKTYFFTEQSSYNAFRDNPWDYVDDPTESGEQ
ncbi:Fe-S-containing protein [Sansalvadorimonas verongulae]|uniref:Fe-S-containing protein n=1 Tax=Sansalvadorimonas verongulae TaxID=2172824 RepID=UPI0012BC801A|nr:Fe-S-containing protein [Sansalvadorimonas verongulae]MTI15401.1 DUF2318 domain-containing protein [Sansalvadorimonas verongulae]